MAEEAVQELQERTGHIWWLCCLGGFLEVSKSILQLYNMKI